MNFAYARLAQCAGYQKHWMVREQNAYNYGFDELQLWFKFLSDRINELLSVEVVLPCDSAIHYRPCQAPSRAWCNGIDDKTVEMAGHHTQLEGWLYTNKAKNVHGSLLTNWIICNKIHNHPLQPLELESTYFGPWVKIARSFVIFPESTTDTQAVSNFSANSWSFAFPSNNPLHSWQEISKSDVNVLLIKGKDSNQWMRKLPQN